MALLLSFWDPMADRSGGPTVEALRRLNTVKLVKGFGVNRYFFKALSKETFFGRTITRDIFLPAKTLE